MSHIHYITPQPLDYNDINQKIKDFFGTEYHSPANGLRGSSGTEYPNLIGKCWIEAGNTIKQYDPRICINLFDLNTTTETKQPIQPGFINIYHRNDIVERIETNWLIMA
jgi:hypothetical protein